MNRIVWFDKLKAFAMFLVIWGHIILNCIPGEQKYDIAGLIYHIHIPLFLIISGILIKEKTFKETTQTIVKKFVIPYIVWCVILSSFYIGTKLFSISLIKENLIIIANGISNDFLWFIKAYVLSYLLYQLLPYKNITKCISGTILLLILNIVFINNNNLSQIFSLTLYTYTFLSISTIFKSKIQNLSIYGCLFIILFLLLLKHATWENNYFTASFREIYNSPQWHIYATRLIIGFSISLALISLKNIKYLNSETLLSRVGQHTLSIYMLQSLLVEAVLPRFVTIEHSFIGIIYSLILSFGMLLICYFIINQSKRIKFVNNILFGF